MGSHFGAVLGHFFLIVYHFLVVWSLFLQQGGPAVERLTDYRATAKVVLRDMLQLMEELGIRQPS